MGWLLGDRSKSNSPVSTNNVMAKLADDTLVTEDRFQESSWVRTVMDNV